MKKLAVATLALLVLGVCAPRAVAAFFTESITEFVFLAPGSPTGTPEIDLPVSVTGTLSVEFHGSAAAGCAALGRCSFSGTEVFDPGRSGHVLLDQASVGGKRKLIGSLVLDGAEPTAAHTERASGSGVAGSCADVAGDSAYFTTSLAAHPVDSLSIGIGSSSSGALSDDLFASRCAGPLGSDLAPFLPSRRLSRSLIEHGGKLDLSTTKPFSAAGFAGILRSTIVLRFGHARRLHFPTHFGGKHPTRLRETVVAYRVERVAGHVGLTFSGLGDPAQCLALDACGTSGTIGEAPVGNRGTFDFFVITGAARPRRDARTLLGLATAGRTAGLTAFGIGVWFGHGGGVQSSVTHDDGGPPCTDSQNLKTGALTGSVRHSHLRLRYGPPDADNSLSTRCGGPLQSDLVAGQALASGELPVSALRRKTLTIHLKRPPSVVPTTGYTGSIQSDITITLQRIAVRERILRF
ncbi:MAG TPA: hypothetical protein VJU60_13835 [Thermoleophilaceae bacterium]|nr:hypothetical protein [Thermoleophilaceae bacterium]